MESENSTRNPKLSLSFGFSSDKPENNVQFGCPRQSLKRYLKSPKDCSPSLTLFLPSENEQTHEETLKQQELSHNRQEMFLSSGVSSFSNNSGSVKRERDVCYEEIEKVDDFPSKIFVEPPSNYRDHHQEAARKKLRLTKQQAAILEGSFGIHNTLHPKQKQELAERLTLRPRQVEVWFQNRRARSKLKQSEVERELMNKCCETLRNENIMLYKEVEQLKADIVRAHPLTYMQLFPHTTLSLCSSCEKFPVAYQKASTEKISFTRPPANITASSHHQRLV